MMLLCSFPCAAQEVLNNIRVSMKAGDSEALAQLFDNTVEMTYPNTQSSYSRTQAQMILKSFYAKNKPKDFIVQYTGESPEGDATYVIGALTTKSGKYRVYFYISHKGDKHLIQELKISR
jgi:ABC-type transporter MlaC component